MMRESRTLWEVLGEIPSGRGDRAVAGPSRRQRDHRGPDAAQGPAAERRGDHRGRDVLSTCHLSSHPRRWRRLPVHRQSQPTGPTNRRSWRILPSPSATLFPPELLAAFQGQPPPPAGDGPPPDCESAQSVEKGHGRIEHRRIEHRRITVSREGVPALDWPAVAQICRIERIREVKGF
jgi:hypothetical protein